jgi:HEAT repeat protein
MSVPWIRGLCVVGLLLAALPAHGGQYRAPVSAVPPPPPPGPGGGPGGPAPPAPSAPKPGVATGVAAVAEDNSGWATWWEFNKEPFLAQRQAPDSGPVSGSDDFYIGFRRAAAPVDMLAPTELDLRDRIVPTLGRLLEKERNRDIVTACLVALGKVGRDAPGFDLEAALSAHIARDDQEVRETAVLSLGIAGRDRALSTLASLLRDTAEGRKLSERNEVADRTRAFAAYGLGLLAMRKDDAAFKQQVHDLLWPMLLDKEIKSRDLQTAVVNALGILRCHPERGAQKRLLWQTVEELLDWFADGSGRLDEPVQAQAPIAIARLLGRGSSDLHRKCKQQFAEELWAKHKRGNAILQSAAIALGDLALPKEQLADDAPFSEVLQQTYARGSDRQARWFALIALGRIGGTQNREFLLAAYDRSNKASERPWVALALGLLAAGGASRGEVDAPIARLLLEDLQAIQNNEVQGALAVALGLTGHTQSAPVVMRLLRDHEAEQVMAGYFCVSLALLGEKGAVPMLSAILERSERRPFLLQQCAVALGRLGDKEASLRLVTMMQKSESVAVLSALAVAVGRIGDRRAIEPLIEMTKNDELTRLARAFVCAALGGVGDKDPLPWNVPLTVDCNYAAPADTLTNGSTGVLDIL